MIFFAVMALLATAIAPARAQRGSSRTAAAWRRNPFVPLLTPRQPETASPHGSQAAAGRDFARSPALELKAIINSKGSCKAIIGTRLVQVGDQVEGFRVAAIEADRVVLHRGGKPLELHLSSLVAAGQNFVIKKAR